ncbi:NAD(P)-binding protein [Lojkania enalia]|uniref:NAD(P)-binding protein n=1 Tax=Lojkania enalia TaxID=147567 RepID=A0A9P4JWJ5_9PLEO|nr:NAD(P)-binding protein [Didymosphaeria enalia]
MDILSQFFPPKPKFTEKDLPDLHGKVYIITGSNTGVGKELAQILYSKNATVYIAARSQTKAESAISSIKSACPTSTGSLIFLLLDLADLSTIKASASEFLAKETKLNVLFNNAGLQAPPAGSKSVQGYELQLGVNCLGGFLLTKLLTPILIETAKHEPQNNVRVVWVASQGAEIGSYSPGGIDMDNLNNNDGKISPMSQYARTKAGNYFQGTEYAKLYKNQGIVSIPLNPGNLDSDLYRGSPVLYFFLHLFLLHRPIFGAYTELFAGLSPEVTIEKSGSWVAPWGRFLPIRKDLVQASKSKEEGGMGIARRFWAWQEEQVKQYS